jgi:hypothetical protein
MFEPSLVMSSGWLTDVFALPEPNEIVTPVAKAWVVNPPEVIFLAERVGARGGARARAAGLVRAARAASADGDRSRRDEARGRRTGAHETDQ